MLDLISQTVGPAIAVETEPADRVWTLVDPHQLENALLNLCINARDAMPDGGRLSIITSTLQFGFRQAGELGLQPGDYISMCVTDTGTGMPADVAERAFDPFFTTKPIGVGTGLGLSMIYGFARQSGGNVHIDSTVGKGTTICIYLPRHERVEASEEKAATQPAAMPASEGSTILVVDDEPMLRMLVVDVLEELGYAAIEADDGPQAMAVLESRQAIDLLVTDVGLPNGMNGRQVADAARVLRPGLKILFVTGYAEKAVLNHGHLEPGMEVVTKPFNMDDLTRRIHRLIEED